MNISLIAARSENGIIGDGPKIPWRAKGEQLLFKALTFNQWLLVGRVTFESMGVLADRKYAVLTRSQAIQETDDVRVFGSVDDALAGLAERTDHVIVAGGGQIYKATMSMTDTIHQSIIHRKVDGNVRFPEIPSDFTMVYSQRFQSNIDYTYQVWRNNKHL